MKKRAKIKQLSLEECKQIQGGNSPDSDSDLNSTRGGWYHGKGASGGVLFHEYSIAMSKPTTLIQFKDVKTTFSPC